MDSTWKEEVIGLQVRLLDPIAQGVTGDCRDLELNWALCLLLHDNRTRSHLIPMTDITHLECNKVTPPQFAVNAEVEECQLSNASFHLQTHTQSPDLFDLERGFLANNLPLIPWLVVSSFA